LKLDLGSLRQPWVGKSSSDELVPRESFRN
jgi:hypothetical protein